MVMEDHEPIFTKMNDLQKLICSRLCIDDPNVRLMLFVDPEHAGVSDVEDTHTDITGGGGYRCVETIEEFNNLLNAFQSHISGQRDDLLDTVFQRILEGMQQQEGCAASLRKLVEVASLGRKETDDSV